MYRRLFLAAMSLLFFFFSSRRRHTRCSRDWSSDVCSSDLDGASVEQARAEMNSIATELAREFPKDYPPESFVKMTPLRESWYGRVQSALWMLLGATVVVLLIACANVASLLLARAASKQREVALRAALGASRLRIVRQLLNESTLVS